MQPHYDYICKNCNKTHTLDYKTAWFTCNYCGEYQATGILCMCCNHYFRPKNNTWAYTCPNCKNVVDSNGKKIANHNILVCDYCNETLLKSQSYAKGGKETGLYKCKVCSSLLDDTGAALTSSDVVECEICHSTLIRANSLSKRGWNVGENALYHCPLCHAHLDYTGHCVDLRKMDKCNSCNIVFDRKINHHHPWIIACPQCGQYVDHEGDPIAKRFIEVCSVCSTVYTTWDHEPICPICETPKGAEVHNHSHYDLECPNCNAKLTSEDIGSRGICNVCGFILSS